MNQIYPPNLFAPIIIVEPRNFVADTDTGDIIANTEILILILIILHSVYKIQVFRLSVLLMFSPHRTRNIFQK